MIDKIFKVCVLFLLWLAKKLGMIDKLLRCFAVVPLK